MPINIQGKQTQPLGYKKGPGLDSKGRAGPTLQSIADRARVNRSNAQMMESIFDIVSPLSMYSGDAEGAYLPSKAMQNAQGLAKVFQDWYKGGTPTINIPFDTWPNIMKSGKFKNQMELAGKDSPDAWIRRIEIEKRLGGYPYPREVVVDDKDAHAWWLKETAKRIRNEPYLTNAEKLSKLKDILQKQKSRVLDPEYSESLAKKQPVYGHLYNPKYNHKNAAIGFGNTHAEMSDLVKEQSKYVLGDSGAIPFDDNAYSSSDLLGKTSRLERALFSASRNGLLPEHVKTSMSDYIPFMEMWVPNHLARLNNVRSVHVPGRAMYDSVDRAVPIRELPNLVKQKQQTYKDIEDGIPTHLKGSMGPDDMWDGDDDLF